jgi:hypothetical protein
MRTEYPAARRSRKPPSEREFRTAGQPISPQVAGNSLIASQSGFGVVPEVRLENP